MSLRIDAVEIDDGNAHHLTQHGVTLAEVEDVFLSHPTCAGTSEAAPATTTPSPRGSG